MATEEDDDGYTTRRMYLKLVFTPPVLRHPLATTTELLKVLSTTMTSLPNYHKLPHNPKVLLDVIKKFITHDIQPTVILYKYDTLSQTVID